mgnify:CR=1 FL=1
MLHQKIDEGSLCEGSIPDMLRDIAILLQGIKETLADMLLITFQIGRASCRERV